MNDSLRGGREMTKLFLHFIVTALFLFSPMILMADETGVLKKEINELKARLDLLEAEDENLLHSVSDLVNISGYADGEFIMTDEKGMNNEFRVHHLSIFLKKQIAEKWRVFSEIEFEDAPNTEEDEGTIFVEVFTIDYNHNPYINFRLGRFLTPGGIWNVDHYPPFVLTQEQPQHIREIFPQLNDGLQFYGSANVADVVADYILYASNGQGTNTTAGGDGNEDKAVGTRLKFKFPFLSKIETGFSYYTEEKDTKEDLRAAGADLLLQWKNLKLQGEYAKGFLDPASGSIYQTIGYYGQLEYLYNNWTLGYRYDWYDPKTTVDNDRKTINTIALNYHFTPYVVGKIEHHFVDPQASAIDNYTKTLLSVAVYLGN
jgi:hypothetical protein